MKKNMAITMVKDVFKEPHFQIKPTHIIFRFLVPFLLIVFASGVTNRQMSGVCSQK